MISNCLETDTHIIDLSTIYNTRLAPDAEVFMPGFNLGLSEILLTKDGLKVQKVNGQINREPKSNREAYDTGPCPVPAIFSFFEKKET